MYLPDTDLLSMVYLKVEGPPLKHKITPLLPLHFANY